MSPISYKQWNRDIERVRTWEGPTGLSIPLSHTHIGTGFRKTGSSHPFRKEATHYRLKFTEGQERTKLEHL